MEHERYEMKKCIHPDSLRSCLRPGRFYNLLNPVGPIPAGVYRYEDWSEGSAIFSVSSDRAIFFGLSGLDTCAMNEVPYSRGRRSRVRPLEFASHYFKYLAQEARHLCDCEWRNDGNAFTDESPKTPQLTICSIPLTNAMLSDRSIMEQMFEIERQMPEGPHYLTSEILDS